MHGEPRQLSQRNHAPRPGDLSKPVLPGKRALRHVVLGLLPDQRRPFFAGHFSDRRPPRTLAGDRPYRRDYRRSAGPRSEEHTSELQSLMRISYAVFCLKKKKKIISIKLTSNN